MTIEHEEALRESIAKGSVTRDELILILRGVASEFQNNLSRDYFKSAEQNARLAADILTHLRMRKA